MHCLYCKKRLWLFFSKERVFCSKQHETAYHDQQSAMRRLLEFTEPVERPVLPAPRNRPLSEIYRESQIHWGLSVADPPLCNLVVEWERPKPIPLDASTALLLQAVPFAGSIQFPSTKKDTIALSLDYATEPASEIAMIANNTIANEKTATCRLRSTRRRPIPPQSPAAFSSRTHRRRVR